MTKWNRIIGALFASAMASAAVAQDQPASRALSEQELVDMLVGACIQSTRGCDPSGSIEAVRAALAEGKEFTLLSVEGVPEDGLVVAVQWLGGGGAWEHVTERTEAQGLPTLTEPEAEIEVIKLFAEHMGQEVTALIRSEAAGATATALLLAAELGIPTLDAGITGRAVPEVQQSIPWINGMASVPTAVITPWGDEIIIRHAVDEYRVEDMTRAIAVASGGDAVITMAPMSGAQLGQGTLAGNVTEALVLGRTVREAREAGEDPIAALLEVTGGYELFTGVTTKSDERGDRGFHWVDVEIEGDGDYAGQTYAVFVKNENIIGWRDGEVDAMSPDYIYNLNPETGEAIRETEVFGGYPVGERVVLIAVPAHMPWRSERGVELMGPRHFGFDFDYVPIDELQSR